MGYKQIILEWKRSRLDKKKIIIEGAMIYNSSNLRIALQTRVTHSWIACRGLRGGRSVVRNPSWKIQI